MIVADKKTVFYSREEDKLLDSIVALTKELVCIPSQNEINNSGRVLDYIASWLNKNHLKTKLLYKQSNSLSKQKIEHLVGIEATVGDLDEPVYCLNACGDTAPVGNQRTWDYKPFSGKIVDGWLYGRGSADSKVAISIFAHILVSLKSHKPNLKGCLSLIVDTDEHSGRFSGIKRYIEDCENHNKKISGIFIGYPGNHDLKIGARGFYRTRISVYGTSQHSGSSKKIVGNAVVKAGVLIHELSKISLPDDSEPNFPLNPTLNITAIEGGKGYTSIPDLCIIKVDVRLTPNFKKSEAKQVIENIVAQVDKNFPTYRETFITSEQSWPAYRLGDDNILVKLLINASKRYFNRDIPTAISGPSNVGNYLASKGIDAICGFGVSYRNIHAANECIEIDSILPTYYTYRDTILNLLQ